MTVMRIEGTQGLAQLAGARSFRLGCGLLAVILVSSLLSAGATPVAVGLFAEPWDKLAHFCVYGAMAALFALGLGGRRPLLAIAFTLAVGLADEGLQFFEPGRSPDLADLAADVASAILVSTLVAWWLAARRPLLSPP